jgi:hypothetical protein
MSKHDSAAYDNDLTGSPCLTALYSISESKTYGLNVISFLVDCLPSLHIKRKLPVVRGSLKKAEWFVKYRITATTAPFTVYVLPSINTDISFGVVSVAMRTASPIHGVYYFITNRARVKGLCPLIVTISRFPARSESTGSPTCAALCPLRSGCPASRTGLTAGLGECHPSNRPV